MPWRQVFKHAWAKGCSGVSRVPGELPFHNTRNSSRYCNKPTCISFTSDSWSIARGCFGKGDCLWWFAETCHPFLHPLCGCNSRSTSQVNLLLYKASLFICINQNVYFPWICCLLQFILLEKPGVIQNQEMPVSTIHFKAKWALSINLKQIYIVFFSHFKAFFYYLVDTIHICACGIFSL